MEKLDLLSPEEIAPIKEKLQQVLDRMNDCLYGREKLHQMLLVALLARGHVLLEGLPGLGKTAMVHTLSQLLDLNVNRIQFTPDLMPSDILGYHILQEDENKQRKMRFQTGPVFCNFLLGDEINRASPKTQSALLEAMQEKTVTLMGESRKLPKPFLVLATQNPIELEGTYPLPEAQLDRFLFKLQVESLDTNVLEKIISTRHHGIIPEQLPVLSLSELNSTLNMTQRVLIPKAVANYIARLVANTDPANQIQGLSDYFKYGASPRAAIAIAESSRALALFAGRPTVGFDDVELVAPWALQHRVVLEYKAKSEMKTSLDLIHQLIKTTSITEKELPKSVQTIPMVF